MKTFAIVSSLMLTLSGHLAWQADNHQKMCNNFAMGVLLSTTNDKRRALANPPAKYTSCNFEVILG